MNETYERMTSLLIEYEKRSPEYWKSIRLGRELTGGKQLSPKQRRKESLTKTRADRKRADKSKKDVATRRALRSLFRAQPHRKFDAEGDERHYL